MSNVDWSIRPATIDDTAVLAKIVMEATKAQGRWKSRDTAEERWLKEYADWGAVQVEAADPGNILSVIEERGRVVGRLRVVRDIAADRKDSAQSRRIELAGMQLRPGRQGRGIGTAIIRELQSEAVRHGVPLELRVEKDNPHARRLYERLGFVIFEESDNEQSMRWVESS